jgi:hypothetical protein
LIAIKAQAAGLLLSDIKEQGERVVAAFGVQIEGEGEQER